LVAKLQQPRKASSNIEEAAVKVAYYDVGFDENISLY
jgi:hypothetical protein